MCCNSFRLCLCKVSDFRTVSISEGLQINILLEMDYLFYSEEKQYVKLPWDIEDARNLGRVLARYKEKYYFEVFSGVCVTYILYPFQN